MNRDLDDVLLERYFLGPGSSRKIGSIYVADDDLLDIFGAQDLDSAIEIFKNKLPGGILLKDYLSGNPPAHPGRKPDYLLRILLFLCWMQTTKAWQRSTGGDEDREFRKMLERHFGDRIRGASMLGLNPMWERLQGYLSKNYDIELNLPSIEPYVRIGRTLRIAFPTWRDHDALRKVRGILPESYLLDPLVVGNCLRTSRLYLAGRFPALDYNFAHFSQLHKQGGLDYMATPFWRVWYSIVAEKALLEVLEVHEGEYGDFTLFRVSPLGERVRIISPEEGYKFIPKAVSSALKKGYALLENMGFGRLQVVATQGNGAALLVKKNRLSDLPSYSIRSMRNLNSEWLVVMTGAETKGKQQGDAVRGFGWHDGIRIGGAFLGRTPLSPQLSVRKESNLTVKIAGKSLSMVRKNGSLSLPPGTYQGTALAHDDNDHYTILLVPHANEIPNAFRLTFDQERHISEDEFYHGTAPSLSMFISVWKGKRIAPTDALISIGEALYARSARSLPLGEAFELASRGLSDIEDPPLAWDVIRILIDAGWFDGVLLRHFPTRSLLLCPLTAEAVDEFTARISGPTPIAVVQRIQACAQKSGTIVERMDGPTAWSLPRYIVRSTRPKDLADFLQRLGAPHPVPFRKADAVGEQGGKGVHGYHVLGRFDEEKGVFWNEGKYEDGLFRMERRAECNPHIYHSIVPGKPDRAFQSPVIAILFHSVRRGGDAPFAFDGTTILAKSRRIFLPASWARWVSNVTLTNSGIMRTKTDWRYVYPATSDVMTLLGRVLPVRQVGANEPKWLRYFLISANNRNRPIFDAVSGGVKGLRIISRNI